MTKMKVFMDRKGVDFAELSKNTEISERYLRFIEKGEKTPSLPVAKKIADSLNATVDEIFLCKECTIST